MTGTVVAVSRGRPHSFTNPTCDAIRVALPDMPHRALLPV
jgi:hypothetical protein